MHAILLVLAIAAIDGTKIEKIPDTAEAIFQEAVGHWGSSGNDAAMVTIVDGHTGRQQTVCVEVDVLGWAVSIEHDIKWSPGNMGDVTERMRSQKDRRFTFLNPEALATIGKNVDYAKFDEELCNLIRKNVYAFRGDIPPKIYVGKVRK